MSSAYCISGTENYPDAGIKLTSVADKFCQGYDKNLPCFEHMTKDVIFQTYITHCVFLITNVNARGIFKEDIG